MDVGPAKVRRRGSVGVFSYNVQFRFTEAQLTTFREWYEDDLGQGADSFEFTEPLERVTAIFRFATEGYSVQRLGGGRWLVSMAWERLPQ
jgi:hypothetical protein